MRMTVKKAAAASMRGILHAEAARDKYSLTRFAPGAPLKPFIEYYWIVRYDVQREKPYIQRILSFPNVHLAFEHDDDGRRALIYGIPRRPYVRELRGAGHVLGVRFRAGGFYPFWRQEMSTLTGRTILAADVFGPDAGVWLNTILDAEDDEEMAGRAEAALMTRMPDPAPRSELADRIVRGVMDDRAIIRVEQLSERTGLSVRQLQRLFQRYVGVTPKWVIRRFRLQEAAERIERDASISWAELAMQLGYFDQAHFIKDFKAVLGQPPSAYRKGPESR